MNMNPSTIISLDRPGRILKKTREYLADMDVFLSEIPRAITILIDGLAIADSSLTTKILPLLAAAGKERALWPLFHVMMDASTEGEIRRAAAVQLGLAASLSGDPSVLNGELIRNLDHPDSLVRGSCALALGWEGNGGAVPALMDHLQDEDRDVQADVVAALSSINDGRVFDHLTDRLKTGKLEEQRSIFLNLWRFAEWNQGVETVYRDSLNWVPGELVPDILSAVSMIPHTATVLSIYHRMLSEDNAAIRQQVLENLEALDPADYQSLNACLHGLLMDRDNQVRQVATRLLARSANRLKR